jgi:single-stranded-DNA-specific exonuclease
VVPLTGLNRAFTHQGLKVMRRWNSAGLVALGRVARLDGPPEAYHAGFLLGPRINAGGRVGQADMGVRLLTTQSHAEAEELAVRLDEYNRERQAIEAEVQSAALQQAEAMLAAESDRAVICVGRDGWHPGVIGIAAGRLKDRFNRPVLVIGFDESGQGKGSGRSIPGVNLGAAVTAAMENGVIRQGGGHAMAAGLSLDKSQMDAFAAFMDDRLKEEVEVARAGDALKLDGALTARGATLELAAMLEKAGPFGAGNPRPRFAFPAHRIVFADIVGNGHVRCTLRADDGARLDAIAFRAADTRWGQELLTERQMPLHVAGSLKCDRWQGREKVKLTIEDVARPRNG